MSEVFKQTTLSGSGGLSYPWEITYGPDNIYGLQKRMDIKCGEWILHRGLKRLYLTLAKLVQVI